MANRPEAGPSVPCPWPGPRSSCFPGLAEPPGLVCGKIASRQKVHSNAPWLFCCSPKLFLVFWERGVNTVFGTQQPAILWILEKVKDSQEQHIGIDIYSIHISSSQMLGHFVADRMRVFFLRNPPCDRWKLCVFVEIHPAICGHLPFFVNSTLG